MYRTHPERSRTKFSPFTTFRLSKWCFWPSAALRCWERWRVMLPCFHATSTTSYPTNNIGHHPSLKCHKRQFSKIHPFRGSKLTPALPLPCGLPPQNLVAHIDPHHMGSQQAKVEKICRDEVGRPWFTPLAIYS